MRHIGGKLVHFIVVNHKLNNASLLSISYARTAVTFLTLQTPGFETSVYATQQQILEQLESYTDAFLEPFFLMSAMDGDDQVFTH